MLPDIQKTKDTRAVAIERVGVCAIKMPVCVKRRGGGTLDTVGTFEMSCGLASDVKGTHMSRFTQVLNAFVDKGGAFHADALSELAGLLIDRMESHSVFIKVELDYFMEQKSPSTGISGIAPLKAFLSIEKNKRMGWERLSVGVVIDGKTCCPCSREISDFDHETQKGRGAHAQRGTITMRVEGGEAASVWFEDLVEIAWKSFSNPVYPLLKRPDEREVTIGAYSNPKFVEDVIRDCVVQLRKLPVCSLKVRVQNAESIHYHDAYGEVEETIGVEGESWKME